MQKPTKIKKRMDSIMKWMKRPQVWGFVVSVAAIYIISLAFFYPDNFEGNTLLQADSQQGVAIGQEGKAYQEATGEKALWTNSIFSGMPTFQISPSYPSNSLFAWIDHVYGGFLPQPSNLLFMMMLGFLILLYCLDLKWWYALIGAVAWGLSSYFIIIIGAGHIWKFVALSYIPPTIGGMVLCYRRRYAIGGAVTALFAMMQFNANHPQMSYYFAFVMAGLAIAYLADAIRAKRVKAWVAASAIVAGACLLGVGANLPSLYNTYEYAKETKRNQTELTTPRSDNAPAERPTGGLPKADIVNWSYGGSEMVTLLVPNVKGGASAKPEKGRMVALGLDRVEASKDVPYDVQPLMQMFSQYFNDSEGTNGPVYVGAIICALFLLGCFTVRGPMKWALLALTVMSALLALGRNFSSLTDLMIYHFPLYNKFRAVESILVIAEFTMPLLAVLALAQWIDTRGEGGKSLKALYYSYGLCAAVCLLGIVAPSAFGNVITQQDQAMMSQLQQYYPDAGIQPQRVWEYVRQVRYGMITADAWRSLVLLVIAFALMWLYQRGKVKGAGITAAAVGVLVLCDLYGVDKRYVSHDSFVDSSFSSAVASHFAPDAIDQAIMDDADADYRVMDLPGFGSPDRAYHHKMVGGYHAAKLGRYDDLIQRRMAHVLGIGYIPELRDDSVASLYGPEEQATIRELVADYRVLDMLNARYIITGDKEQPVVYNPDALGNAWLVDEIEYAADADAEMAALGNLDPAHQAVADKKFLSVLGQDVVKPEAGDTIYLTHYTPNQLTYEAAVTHDAIGVFSEVYFPWGWHATIDGHDAELARVNYVLRAMRIPAGKHQIVMTFDPASLHVTGTVAYASVTLIYLWLIGGLFAWGVMRRRNDSDGVA